MRAFWIVIGAAVAFAWLMTLALLWVETGHLGIPWQTFLVANVFITICIAFGVLLAKLVVRLEG